AVQQRETTGDAAGADALVLGAEVGLAGAGEGRLAGADALVAELATDAPPVRVAEDDDIAMRIRRRGPWEAGARDQRDHHAANKQRKFAHRVSLPDVLSKLRA